VSEEGVERKLTTIFAADVVGYSRLMGEDEAGTLARLKSLRKELVQPKIAGGRGRIVKLMGDGLLAEFPSVVEAVRCAVDIQQDMAGREAGLPDERRIRLRIGVNLGDIIVEGSDIYGDGVNVAARLEGLAEPGGICISGKVYEEVRNKLPTAFEDLGEQEVKNIREPVRVYRWTDAAVDPVPDMAGAKAGLPLPDKPSIAVLPFDNMSDDPEQEYFADGMAEDIITALSKYRSFFVSARNSTFTYKSSAVDVKQVGRDLGVRYVLEGSVRRSGNRVRITAQLIEAESGNHIWAERYDREMADLFDLQDEITQSIVTTVIPELTDAEHARGIRKPPENLDAWELYQRGMWHAYRLTETDLSEAEDLLRKSIAMDPTFAAPWSGLGFVLQHQTAFGWTKENTSRWPEALQAAREAIMRDERDALAHAVMARILVAEDKVSQALRSAQRAVEHNENSSLANMTLSMALVAAERAPEALSHIDRALRLSPRDPLRWTHEIVRGYTLMVQVRYDEAKQSFESSALYNNAGFWPYVHLAHLYVLMGQIEEARAAVRDALALQPDLTISHFVTFSALVGKRSLESYANNLKLAGLPE